MAESVSYDQLLEENRRLKAQLADLNTKEPPTPRQPLFPLVSELGVSAVSRYSRQILLDEVGIEGQLKLASASVLIVGAGGLGCPSALYLAAAGVGTIGVVDHDAVSLDNLHRQIAHTEARVGTPKTESLCATLHGLNSTVRLQPITVALSPENAEKLVSNYDVVLDCTDNVATRYLLNDACVLQHKPLVSGSALRFDGQLTVYNYNGGPCYRCVHPTAPPAGAVTNCSEGGVVGMVPGVIGVLQALLAMHVIIGSDTMHRKMMIFDGAKLTSRTFALRPRDPACIVCSASPSIRCVTDVDYPVFCGAPPHDSSGLPQPRRILENDELTIQPAAYRDVLTSGQPHVLLDVRGRPQARLVSFAHAKNIPYGELENRLNEVVDLSDNGKMPVYVMCRRGNDSQRATALLQQRLPYLQVRNVWGGVEAWHHLIDPQFPLY